MDADEYIIFVRFLVGLIVTVAVLVVLIRLGDRRGHLGQLPLSERLIPKSAAVPADARWERRRARRLQPDQTRR